MSILKMRDENGNIHSIAIMKGDKGVGVPDGGSAGQVLKKTESGTAWADPPKYNTLIMSNEDISVNSVSITQRGLYEISVYFESYNLGSNSKNQVFIMSVSDLDKTFSERKIIQADYETDDPYIGSIFCIYKNGEITVTFDCIYGVSDHHSHLAEVKLLIPYD